MFSLLSKYRLPSALRDSGKYSAARRDSRSKTIATEGNVALRLCRQDWSLKAGIPKLENPCDPTIINSMDAFPDEIPHAGEQIAGFMAPLSRASACHPKKIIPEVSRNSLPITFCKAMLNAIGIHISFWKYREIIEYAVRRLPAAGPPRPRLSYI